MNNQFRPFCKIHFDTFRTVPTLLAIFDKYGVPVYQAFSQASINEIAL